MLKYLFSKLIKQKNHHIQLDWNAPIVPGKALLNLALETSFDDCLALLKSHRISKNLIRFKNSPLMRMYVDKKRETIRLKPKDNFDDDVHCMLAHFYFENESLKRITTYFNEEEFSKGEIHNCRLGSKILDLLPYYDLHYDDGDESVYAMSNGVYMGLELYGGCCDLTQDPDQIIAGLVVSNIPLIGTPGPF